MSRMSSYRVCKFPTGIANFWPWTHFNLCFDWLLARHTPIGIMHFQFVVYVEKLNTYAEPLLKIRWSRWRTQNSCRKIDLDLDLYVFELIDSINFRMRTCSVSGCRNRSPKNLKRLKRQPRFFKLRNEWVHCLNLTSTSSSTHVCQDHFQDADVPKDPRFPLAPNIMPLQQAVGLVTRLIISVFIQ